MHLVVQRRAVAHMGWLTYANTSVACALGPAGIVAQKREGDGATPAGKFRLLQVYYRPDRLPPPVTTLPITPISQTLAWCDDPQHPAYNCPVTRPFSARHEIMWREDHAYDLCVVLDYNLHPPIPERGSAIFFHLTASPTANPASTPTHGCVAIGQSDMLDILQVVSPQSKMIISI